MKSFWIPLALFAAAQSPTWAQRYIVSPDGTEVQDNLAGVVWRRCLEGQSFSFGQCGGTVSTFTHEAALAHAAAVAVATGQDWRVPNVKELGSVVNHAAIQPAIDGVFPNVPNLKSWTSTPMRFSGGTSSAWHVEFFQGYVAGQSRLALNNIRLVRSLP